MTAYKFSYNVYFEAEDVAQSRILSTTSYIRDLIDIQKNPCLKEVVVEEENDMDDFIVRIYLKGVQEGTMEEEDVTMIAPAFAELLSDVAEMQSYLEMEGDFCVEYNGEVEKFEVRSESGDSMCDFEPVS